MANKNFYVVTVEDQVIQVTSYIVLAEDIDHAQRLIAGGVYAFESECEVVDTVSSEIKSVEEIV